MLPSWCCYLNALFSVGLGFFAGVWEHCAGLVLAQGHAAQPKEDSACVTLGKSPLLRVGIHPSSPPSHPFAGVKTEGDPTKEKFPPK